MFLFSRSISSLVDTRCVYSFLWRNLDIPKRVLALPGLFSVTGFCTALLFRSSAIEVLKMLFIDLGTSIASEGWALLPICVDIHFGECLCCVLSVDVVELSAVPKIVYFGMFEPATVGFTKLLIFGEELRSGCLGNHRDHLVLMVVFIIPMLA